MELSGAVILAAGAGTRMKTDTPKVLHTICGETLIGHIIEKVSKLTSRIIIVIGHRGDEIKQYLGENYTYIYQPEPKGTGDALIKALPALPDQGNILVLCGDTPLLGEASLNRLVKESMRGQATLLTAEVPSPKGYGRIIRQENNLIDSIVEEAEASEQQKAICEINAGTYCFEAGVLKDLLPHLSPSPKTGEYYLTDIISMLNQDNHQVVPCLLEDYRESLGVNTLEELYQSELLMRQTINFELMKSGVRMIDPQTTYIDKGVKIESNTVIYPQTIIEGTSSIGSHCMLGPSTHLKDVQLENNVQVRNSVADKAVIGKGTVVGPFAYLRPGTELGSEVKIGDFVEVKNSRLESRVKVPHLSYVGDAEIGPDVNFGAGSIVVNYDGRKKHKTIVEEGAFIGCNSNLIAPIRIGKGAYIAAGSTLNNDVPEEALSIARSQQVNKAEAGKRLKRKKSKDI